MRGVLTGSPQLPQDIINRLLLPVSRLYLLQCDIVYYSFRVQVVPLCMSVFRVFSRTTRPLDRCVASPCLPGQTITYPSGQDDLRVLLDLRQLLVVERLWSARVNRATHPARRPDNRSLRLEPAIGRLRVLGDVPRQVIVLEDGRRGVLQDEVALRIADVT